MYLYCMHDLNDTKEYLVSRGYRVLIQLYGDKFLFLIQDKKNKDKVIRIGGLFNNACIQDTIQRINYMINNWEV